MTSIRFAFWVLTTIGGMSISIIDIIGEPQQLRNDSFLYTWKKLGPFGYLVVLRQLVMKFTVSGSLY
jgi:hypothetical protein